MQEYLLDTNILIYLLEDHKKIKTHLDELKREYFFISIVSYFECLVGAHDVKEERQTNEFLHTFAPLYLDAKVMDCAVKLLKTEKKLKFKDLLIAATAQVEGLTLATADKAFQRMKGLKVKLVKL